LFHRVLRHAQIANGQCLEHRVGEHPTDGTSLGEFRPGSFDGPKIVLVETMKRSNDAALMENRSWVHKLLRTWVTRL
jgi:hypothetical protein